MNSFRPFLLSQLEIHFQQLCEKIDLAHHRFLSLSLRIDEFCLGDDLCAAPDLHYWSCPKRAIAFLGTGCAASFETEGQNRFQSLSDFQSRMHKSWLHENQSGIDCAPISFTGFAFHSEQPDSSLPNTSLHLPEVCISKQPEGFSLTLNWDLLKSKDLQIIWESWKKSLLSFLAHRTTFSDIPHKRNQLIHKSESGEPDRWLSKVESAISDIKAGKLKKIVLSRSIEVEGERPFSPARILTLLEKRYPTCAIIARRTKEGILIAATPEKMISLEHGYASCDALAGTQSATTSDIAAFLSDEKNREEHQLVVKSLVQQLSPLSEQPPCPSTPQLLELRNLRHLHTPISAKIRDGKNLFDLARHIHPTPAVGGYPQDKAVEWIKHREPKRNHWYSGAFGWLTPEGDGELSVVLRSAYLCANTASLSAGAGIVAGSIPTAELEETNIKLNTMLEALKES